MATKPAKFVIRSIRPWQIPALRKLFLQGLHIDFNYFPAEYLDQTDQANSAWRLVLATMRPHRLMYGVWSQKKLIGYLLAGQIPTDTCFIFWIYVDPASRSAEVGDTLLKHVIAECRQLHFQRITLATHNLVDFYRKYGFINKSHKTFAISTTTMYIMELNLKSL